MEYAFYVEISHWGVVFLSSGREKSQIGTKENVDFNGFISNEADISVLYLYKQHWFVKHIAVFAFAKKAV